MLFWAGRFAKNDFTALPCQGVRRLASLESLSSFSHTTEPSLMAVEPCLDTIWFIDKFLFFYSLLVFLKLFPLTFSAPLTHVSIALAVLSKINWFCLRMSSWDRLFRSADICPSFSRFHIVLIVVVLQEVLRLGDVSPLPRFPLTWCWYFSFLFRINVILVFCMPYKFKISLSKSIK